MSLSTASLLTGFLLISQIALPAISAIAVHQKADSGRVLDLTHTPQLKEGDLAHKGRSVNVSFFIPALSLFQMMTQYMPSMFPAFSTQTTSSRQGKADEKEPSKNYFARRTRREAEKPVEEPSWLEKFVESGLVGGF